MHTRKQVPTFSNPRGTTLPTAQRAQIVQLCRTHGVVIFADEGADACLGDGRLPLSYTPCIARLRWLALVGFLGSEYSSITTRGVESQATHTDTQ
jgi:hypothetical protein